MALQQAVRRCQKQNPWIPHKRRGPIAAEFASPGPAAVGMLPRLIGLENHDFTRYRGPGYTFAGSRNKEVKVDGGPGPAAYHPIYNNRCGAPHYTFSGRYRESIPFITPPPGRYSPEKYGDAYLPRSPKFTMGSKMGEATIFHNPSPNAYNIPSILTKTVTSGKNQNPAYSFAGKAKEITALAWNPGPGAYNPIDPNIYKTKPPAYTMISKGYSRDLGSFTPGPGVYNPDKFPLKFAPAYSFGIRHSDFTSPLLVDPVELM